MSDREPLVLLVDDDARIVSLRSEMLSRLGCKVISANSVAEAKAALETAGRSVDLAVIDVNLTGTPGDRSGIRLARAIRDAAPDVPIMGYSGVISADEVSDKEAAGFDRLVVKGRATSAELNDLASWMAQRAREHRDAG